MASKQQLIINHLEAAHAAVLGGDPSAAINSVILAWRIARIARIGDLIEPLARRLPPPEDLFTEKTVGGREGAWLNLAAKEKNKALPLLLSVDWPVHERGARNRMVVFKTFEPDPRLVTCFRTLRRNGRYPYPTGNLFWWSVIDLLSAWEYPRAEMVALFESGPWHGFEDLKQHPMRLPFVPSPELGEPYEASIAELESLLVLPAKKAAEATAARLAELFDAVYESFDDDAPRLVLADFLSEQGDARGEFIQLDIQLAHAQAEHEGGRLPPKLDKRRKLLLRTAGNAWKQTLDPALIDIELRRGFPASASLPRGRRLRFNDATAAAVPPEIDRSFDLRAHRTLESLTVFESTELLNAGKPTVFVDVPLSPHLAGIREILNVSPSFLCSLVEKGDGHHFDHLALVGRGAGWAQFFTPKLATPLAANEPNRAITVRRLTMASYDIAMELHMKCQLFEMCSVEEVFLRTQSLERLPAITREWLVTKAFPRTIRKVTVTPGPRAWTVELSRNDEEQKRTTWTLTSSYMGEGEPTDAHRAALKKVLDEVPSQVVIGKQP